MLKRKILAAVLPVVAAATVVGSGFSAWYFGNFQQTNVSNVAINTEVTESGESIGTLKTYLLKSNSYTEYNSSSNFPKLQLDQGKGSERITNPNLGISFIDNNETPVAVDGLVFEYSIPASDLKALLGAGFNLEISASIEISKTLANYVEFRTADGLLDNDAYLTTGDKVSTIRLDSEMKYTNTVTEYNNSEDFVARFSLNLKTSNQGTSSEENALLKYTAHQAVSDDQSDITFTGKPSKHNEVEEMRTKLRQDSTSTPLSFNFSVTTSDKTASN